MDKETRNGQPYAGAIKNTKSRDNGADLYGTVVSVEYPGRGN